MRLTASPDHPSIVSDLSDNEVDFIARPTTPPTTAQNVVATEEGAKRKVVPAVSHAQLLSYILHLSNGGLKQTRTQLNVSLNSL